MTLFEFNCTHLVGIFICYLQNNILLSKSYLRDVMYIYFKSVQVFMIRHKIIKSIVKVPEMKIKD